MEKDSAPSQQLQGTDRKDQEPVEPTGDPVHLVLRDSNSTRVHFKDPAVFNISQPGVAAAGIESLLSRATMRTTNKTLKRVAMHLGIVDAGRHKSDANQVFLEVSLEITEIHKRFPKAEITFPSIPQRRSKSVGINIINKTANTVNEYICKLTKKLTYLYYLNTDEDLLDKGKSGKSTSWHKWFKWRPSQ